jgi:DNA end-binding protein Ku
MAARAIASGTISFGLVSIPIKLYTATSPTNVSFNMLHQKCGGRVKQQYFCPVDNEVVDRKELVKGFEHARDQYVQFNEEELKKLESPRELVEFVPLATVDFVYVEKSYYLGPDKGGERAYRLLSESMERTGKVAVGRYFTRGREELVIVRPYKRGLILHNVYYADEVRAFDEVETGGELEFKPVERDLADKLIEQLNQDAFVPDRFKDTYGDRVRAAIEQKVAGKEIVASPEAPQAQIIDLLEALKQSVAATKQAAEAVRGKGPKKAGGAKAEKKVKAG